MLGSRGRCRRRAATRCSWAGGREACRPCLGGHGLLCCRKMQQLGQGQMRAAPFSPGSGSV
jgi:hypothetical protein